MTLPRLLGLGLSLTLLTACPGAGDEGGGETNSEESDESGNASCIGEVPCDAQCDDDLPALACSAPQPCEALDMLGCEGGGGFGLTEENAEILQCMVDALIAQEPMQLRMSHANYTDYEHLNVVIFEDGTVVEHEDVNFNVTRNRYRVGPLRPATYFEDCNALTDTCDKLSCIQDWIDEDACEIAPALPNGC